MAIPQELMFQNQLQFNMNVPLTRHNMATHFHKPHPITIERTTSAPSAQGFPMAQLAGRELREPSPRGHEHDGYKFSVLSQDRMAAAVQMAKRDLKTQKLQQRQEKVVQGRGRTRSPSPGSQHQQKPIHGTKQWESRRSRMPKKSHSNMSSRGSRMGVKEHDRNCAPRNAGSQTPPTSPPRQVFLNTKVVPERERSDSPPTRDTPSVTRVARVPSDDIEKLQMEMELCLQQIESVQRRALSEHSTDFLRRGQPRAQKDSSHLVEEEGEERRRFRASEQSHRALRTIYNLQQQVREIERHGGKIPRDTRATKKSQASLRLMMLNKGAVKLLQTFVGQLPHQDLHRGLPAHFTDLAELVRQVTLLSAGAPLHKDKVKDTTLSPVEKDLIAMVDQVEKLNKDWQQEALSRDSAPVTASQKPPFVTNFANSKSAFTKEHVERPQLHNQLHNERKAVLRAGINALLNAGRGKKKGSKQNVRPYSAPLAQPPRPHHKGVSYKVPTRKPPPSRRGFLLPYQSRPQKSSVPLQTTTHFADPTITANLKASTMLHNPITSQQHSLSEPSSPRDSHSKKVNVTAGWPKDAHYHASYPGASADRSRSWQRSVSPRQQSSRSRSPRVHFKSPGYKRSRSHSPLYHSDSEYSARQCLTSEGETSPSPIPSVASSSSWTPRRGSRSLSPVNPSSRRRPRSTSREKRRQFFLGDADPELVEELFPNDSSTARSHDNMHKAPTKTRKPKPNLSPYFHEVERRLQHKLAPFIQSGRIGDGVHTDQEQLDQVADTLMDEAISEVTSEFAAMEQRAAVAEKGASYIDNPTLENIMQALERMEVDNERLRQKYSSFTFHDSAPTRRRYQKASEVFALYKSEQPREPPAFEVTNTRPPPTDTLAMPRVFTEELTQEPLIFTKDSKAYRPRPTLHEHGEGEKTAPSSSAPLHPPPVVQRQVPQAMRPKTLLSMKQTVVERIADSVERFDYYQRGLKQHLGRRNPFDLYESVADNILRMCCKEVAQELETINADMAENIYTSEFMTETGLPLAPPDLAEDFETDGTAARNLRDTAAAQRTVEAAVSKTVTSLMLPPDEPEIPIVSPKRIAETDGDTSPPWETSLKHVFDATALYEASVTEKPTRDVSQGRSGKVPAKDDDTQLEDDEYDYDDDYTDISDEDEDDESESPRP